jgi:hypothetical protein
MLACHGRMNPLFNDPAASPPEFCGSNAFYLLGRTPQKNAPWGELKY